LQDDARKKELFSFYGTAISLGLNMAVGVVVFTLAGYWVDQKRGGGKAWTLCGIFVGLLYGAYEVWKVVREISRRAEQKGEGAGSKRE
jgi:F0F1-type ATP synthase assembly protein I